MTNKVVIEEVDSLPKHLFENDVLVKLIQRHLCMSAIESFIFNKNKLRTLREVFGKRRG